jgi:putative redox protein
MRSERIDFAGHSGDKLAARLDLPDREPNAAVLFAHCFTCSKDIAAARRIAQRLASLGLAVLRFDFTGLGHSQGEFANTHFSSNVEDLTRAAAYLEERGLPPRILIGHSLGGAAVLAAADKIASAKAVVTIGAPADPAHVTHNFSGSLADIEAKGEAEVTLGGRPFTIKRAFLEDVAASKLTEAIRNLDRALLVLHAPLDSIVGIDNAATIFTAAKHPKSFVTLDDADHLLSRDADADYAADVIAAWSRRYIDSPAADALAPRQGAPEGVVRVSEADPVGFLQDIAAGPKHLLEADEPLTYGGTDKGPTPYQLVAAGLGACTAMTIRMYARRKQLALDHVWVDVTHDKIHGQDCETCETKSGKIDRFHRTITLAGDLTDADRQRLLEIADRCPVHRTLESEIFIESREA